MERARPTDAIQEALAKNHHLNRNIIPHCSTLRRIHRHRSRESLALASSECILNQVRCDLVILNHKAFWLHLCKFLKRDAFCCGSLLSLRLIIIVLLSEVFFSPLLSVVLIHIPTASTASLEARWFQSPSEAATMKSPFLTSSVLTSDIASRYGGFTTPGAQDFQNIPSRTAPQPHWATSTAHLRKPASQQS